MLGYGNPSALEHMAMLVYITARAWSRPLPAERLMTPIADDRGRSLTRREAGFLLGQKRRGEVPPLIVRNLLAPCLRTMRFIGAIDVLPLTKR